MRIISTEKLPIKMWLDDIEDGALDQAKNLANLPFIFKHIAIMPDCHQGYGMPIGGVMATRGVIVPNAVGVDIGCGMIVVKTSLREIEPDALKKIMGGIREVVPVGFARHKNSQENDFVLPGEIGQPIIENEKRIDYQIGTLGGGNHFIEIQKDSDGQIWIMVHSGSRNLGKQVADYYNKLAIEINEKYFSQVPKSWELAFLPMDGAGHAYRNDMQICVDFAYENRRLMMKRILTVFLSVVGGDFGTIGLQHNVAHNYAAMENHFGSNVMVHRKGATRAYEGELGIIPGSQGTKSYIVRGKGHEMSFKSCSHGAGRRMGRKQAKRELSIDAETKQLNDLGVIHSVRSVKDLDEAPGAYKDISKVMANQTELVDIEVELTPLAVIKG